MKYDFGEISNLTVQHQQLVAALGEVFDDLVKNVSNTQAEGFNAASAVAFLESVRDRWNQRATDWANSQGNLARVIQGHADDMQQTDAGPMSNLFKYIGVASA